MSAETGHDVNALVDLATDHADKWGDSCHHAPKAGELKTGEIKRMGD
jgi:hypothetical protein